MKISREIKIGFFAVAMIVCLYLGVNYLKGRDFFSSDRTYTALFDQTRGLQTSAAVLLRGVKIGSVTAIELSDEHPDKVAVTVSVGREWAIPVDSRLKLLSGGLMGGMTIELVRGSASTFFERGAVIPTETENGLLDIASTNFEELAAKATSLMTSLEATSNGLGDLVARNGAGLDGIVRNVETMTRQLSGAGLGEMIRDLREFSSMLSDNSARFEGVARNLEKVSGEVAGADLRATLDTLGMGVASLNGVLAKLSDGDGAAARLLDDPALYDSLTVATGNLASLLEDLRDNPRRYVHFSLFGRRDKERKGEK
ncbi:MAG: MlaD family protein [Alistipes sp.]|jgi:phospholipid/cholesterol/gamma-HCH transport system substrate-binding protein|nr:MlaD family protein [Alistipes sp.]